MQQEFRSRLCHTLVGELLRQVEFDLLEVKSVRFLMDYPWAPGKRLRPITFLLSCLSVAEEKSPARAIDGRESRLAAAIELMHEASLVHDDLVDRSTLRRGRPTMQVVNGEALALLIGDYMIFRGLKLVLDAARTREDILLAQELANTGLAIAQGEADQLDSYLNREDRQRRMSMDTYLGVIANKTAAFFAGCAEAGAALGGADAALRRTYRDFGMNMGLVFQMVDDLMDIVGDPGKAQKTLNNNLDEGTVTLPMVHARELFPDDAALLKLAGAEALTDGDKADLHRLLSSDAVVERSCWTVNTYASAAAGCIAGMPPNIYRAGLHDLLDYIRQCSWGGLDQRLAQV